MNLPSNYIRATLLASVLVATPSMTAYASTDAISKVVNSNAKYTCDAGELDAYIAQVTKPMYVPIPVTSVDEHIQNQMAKKQVEGEADTACFNLAMDNSLFDKISDLIKTIKELEVPVPPNILDSLMKALKQQMDNLYEGICNAMTKEFAQKKIEEYIESKHDIDVSQLKGLSEKENRDALLKDMGEDMLMEEMQKKGVDDRWANMDGDGWSSLAEDTARSKADGLADSVFK
ncbi:hypothetical protein [Vibrio sp. D431a]|uniref:hypothetical protein n=1 Tax=Vibrio sp. D431a TaxID=2837388 RepID=UPI0025555D28|nr:hypothetical protein [Vibrio sp. D431a]MDK9793888.1 hypothetical protein [Vibrio sp. D431a]